MRKFTYKYQGIYDNTIRKGGTFRAFNLGNDFWDNEEILQKNIKERGQEHRQLGVMRFKLLGNEVIDIKTKMVTRKTYT